MEMRKILVVDGRAEERRAIIEALCRIDGVTVQCAISDLETAAGVLARYTPDILVTGTELADGDGLQLVEKVRRRGMAIVVVGPAESREVWRRYLAAGADRFVEPDHDLEELQDVVRGLVQQRGQRGQPGRPETARPDPASLTTGAVHELNNYLYALEVLLAMLERSPDDKNLWTEARQAIEQAVCLNAMLLGNAVDGSRPRATRPV